MTARLHLDLACHALAAGGVIAYPTEGVWGLGCDPDNPEAVGDLLALKQRDWRKGLILIAHDFAALEPWLRTVSNSAMKRALATWPGPATWIFPCADDAPEWLTGEHDSLAVRVSAHPVVQRLCRGFGGAIVSTSANRSDAPPARSVAELRAQFRRRTPFIVPGALGGLEQPTPIRNVITGALLRR
jgi:L-threonylcarbamoyladenylate synthase